MLANVTESLLLRRTGLLGPEPTRMIPPEPARESENTSQNASDGHGPGAGPALALACTVAILCVAFQLTGLEIILRFDRDAINDGAWWRLLSGNFVHLGPGHLMMNLAGLVLVVALVWKRFSAFAWIAIIIGSSLVVGLGLLWRNPEIGWYVGFSGTLHGLIVAGTLADLRVWPRSASLLLLAVAAKLAWEQIGGALPGSESVAGGAVIVDAHLYGAIGGAIFGAILIAAGYARRLPKAS